VKTFASFDGATIAYHDEGEGFPVILLHGYGVDALGQFGSFERILPSLKKDKSFLSKLSVVSLPCPILPPKDARGLFRRTLFRSRQEQETNG
jgi:pimeloyl-ACP methyl ester carboxylesterase